MKFYSIIALVLGAAFIACLVTAYGAALAGLIDWLDARTVSLWTICGGGGAFLAGIGYLLVSERGIQHAIIVLKGHPR